MKEWVLVSGLLGRVFAACDSCEMVDVGGDLGLR